MMSDKKVPTLYEWAGGKEIFKKLFEVFYGKVLKDDLLSPVFTTMSENHVGHVADFVAEVFGGPPLYSEGKTGSHARMVRHHLGKNLTESMRKQWVNLLLESADEIGLVTDPEFRSALVGYVEWGSRLAIMNSQADQNPIDESEPMPKWGWGEVGGPYQG